MPAKYRVKITQSAEGDVEEIWTYISHDNPIQALKFIAELDRQISTLERFPQRCPLIPENETLGTHYRHLLFGDYRTLFKISDKTVYVMRIIHGSRLLDASFFESGPASSVVR
jgi:plasmid stabilization system protein ParE